MLVTCANHVQVYGKEIITQTRLLFTTQKLYTLKKKNICIPSSSTFSEFDLCMEVCIDVCMEVCIEWMLSSVVPCRISGVRTLRAITGPFAKET